MTWHKSKTVNKSKALFSLQKNTLNDPTGVVIGCIFFIEVDQTFGIQRTFSRLDNTRVLHSESDPSSAFLPGSRRHDRRH